MRGCVLVSGVLLAAAFLLSACTSAAVTEAEQQSMAAVATAPATLQPGDKIKVDVFGEDKLGGEYQLDQAGQVSVPLAGTIKAQGMTNAPARAGAGQKIPQRVSEKPEGYGYNCVAHTLLRDWRSAKAWPIRVPKRS